PEEFSPFDPIGQDVAEAWDLEEVAGADHLPDTGLIFETGWEAEGADRSWPAGAGEAAGDAAPSPAWAAALVAGALNVLCVAAGAWWAGRPERKNTAFVIRQLSFVLSHSSLFICPSSLVIRH